MGGTPKGAVVLKKSGPEKLEEEDGWGAAAGGAAVEAWAAGADDGAVDGPWESEGGTARGAGACGAAAPETPGTIPRPKATTTSATIAHDEFGHPEAPMGAGYLGLH